MRTAPPLAGLALVASLLTGCGNGEGEPEVPQNTQREESPGVQDSPESPAEGGAGEPMTVSEEFAADGEAAAVTYDETAVPEGSEIAVTVTPDNGEGTHFQLTASGLEADRDFGAHLHTDACGPNPDDSGPHYQNETDPAADDEPSTDPAYANPENEVWLDFTTDENGEGGAETSVEWQPRDGEANSVVLHAEHTSTEPGEAGMAGDRLACLNLPL